MKFVIPGGSGQVGTVLARAFQSAGHEVVVLSRQQQRAPWRTVIWDAERLGDWASELEGADAVINLAGRNVNCRYTTRNRQLMLESRVKSTQVVGEAIAQATQPPPLWLQASTATIYAHTYTRPNDEATGTIGGSEPDAPQSWGFSIEVAQAWERALDSVATPQTRKVKLRSAMIMSPDRGGVFDLMLGLVRRGLGGKQGDGRQYMSWIHESDFIESINWIISHPELEGVVNLAAPHPLPNDEFMRDLRQAWGIRLGLPAMEWMLAIGTFFLRTETELILKSRRVVPGKLLESGFQFAFPSWPEAARDLCGQWRAAHTR